MDTLCPLCAMHECTRAFVTASVAGVIVTDVSAVVAMWALFAHVACTVTVSVIRLLYDSVGLIDCKGSQRCAIRYECTTHLIYKILTDSVFQGEKIQKRLIEFLHSILTYFLFTCYRESIGYIFLYQVTLIGDCEVGVYYFILCRQIIIIHVKYHTAFHASKNPI